MWVRTHECGPPSVPAAPKAKAKPPAARKRVAGPTISAEQLAEEPRAAALTLDIRGLRVDEALADLAVACCDLEPDKRPTVTDCLSRLEGILADLTALSDLSA